MAGLLDLAVFADGLDFAFLEELEGPKRRLALVRAMNKTVRDLRKDAADVIRQQVNLPASYVAPSQKRLYVSKRATRNSLEAVITAQGRATSLARFASGGRVGGRGGVVVEVAPGTAKLIKRAFLMPLRRGNSDVTDTQRNLGLAIRLKPGEVLRNKLRARRVENGLYLLYGPSVSQVFRNNAGTGVAQDLAPSALTDMENEFFRLLEL